MAAVAPAVSGVVFLGDRRVVRRYRIRTVFLRLLMEHGGASHGLRVGHEGLEGGWRGVTREGRRLLGTVPTRACIRSDASRNMPHVSGACRRGKKTIFCLARISHTFWNFGYTQLLLQFSVQRTQLPGDCLANIPAATKGSEAPIGFRLPINRIEKKTVTTFGEKDEYLPPGPEVYFALE